MKKLAALTVGCALLAGAPQLHAEAIFGLTTSDALVTFDTTTPGTISSPLPITGLVGGDTLLGIDFRPATGQLYGLGSGSRLYLINTGTGVATQVGTNGAFTLSGSAFGFDFNPVPDRIRVVSNTEQDIRLNPLTGGLAATDGAITYAVGDVNFGANPNLVGSAYTNNFPGALTTTLYNIDSSLGVLTIQNPPNSGTNTTVGLLGVGFALSENLGFDISGLSGSAFASFASPTGTNSFLYSINLASGAATPVGAIGGAVLRDFSITPVPEPGTWAMLGLGLAMVLGKLRLMKSRPE